MALPSNTKRKIFDGRYEIISIVGRGADSVVYHARHISGSAQEVALKVLITRKDGTSLADRLRKEALTLVSCRQKYVVRLDDFHSIDQLCYLSMEYAPHGDLTKYIAQKGSPLSPDQAELFLKQSLEALDFIHATGVIHRDIKPENILVVNDQEIRVADFGLALLPGDELESDELKRAAGTFDYLAPEILDGTTFDSRSDLYALGVCFYEVLTGTNPFSGAPLAQQMDARRDGRIRPLEELVPTAPKHLVGVITTLLAFDPRDRFQSAGDALQALADPSYTSPLRTSVATEAHHVIASVSASPTEPLHSIVEPFLEFDEEQSPTAPLNESPANQDIPPARPTQPTEKFDLHRIKSIVAKDSQRKEVVAHRRSQLEDESGEPLGHNAGKLLPQITMNQTSLGTSARTFATAPLTLLSKLPTPLRPVAVAVISAIVTVLVLVAFNSGTPRSTTNPTEETTEPTAAAPASSSSDAVEADSATPTLVGLPEGRYTGTISGLLPNTSNPLILLADPGKHELVLMIGVDGWVPARASTLQEDGSFVESPTFRSNGLILKLNGELSSGQITGTFTDMITGDTGVWTAKRAS